MATVEALNAADEPHASQQPVNLGRLGLYLGFRMRRVHDIQSRSFLALTRDFNLRQGMFSALELIASNPGISQRQLGIEIGLDKSSMVAMLDELELRHWVKRERNARDRRRYHLKIMPLGLQTVDQLFRRLDPVEALGMSALSPTELRAIRAALGKLYSAYRHSGLWLHATMKAIESADLPGSSGRSTRSARRTPE